MIRIYRYEVPVDDGLHVIKLKGEILKVGCRDPRMVEFWAFVDDEEANQVRTFTVMGTGHDIPYTNFRHIGTAISLGNTSGVWHLLELL